MYSHIIHILLASLVRCMLSCFTIDLCDIPFCTYLSILYVLFKFCFPPLIGMLEGIKSIGLFSAIHVARMTIYFTYIIFNLVR